MDTTADMAPSQATRIAQLVHWYGDGGDGSAPTLAQWARLTSLPGSAPVSLINHFKWHAQARYAAGEHLPATGQEAFSRYSAVSMNALARVGGQFVSITPAAGTLLGPDEDWDLLVVAHYPNPGAVLALFEDADYRPCYTHRVAACARQRVTLGAPRM